MRSLKHVVKQGVVVCRVGADHGPAERWQHSGRLLALTEKDGVLAARALEESLVDVMLQARIISSGQHKVALRLKSDFCAARLGAHLSGSYNPERNFYSHFGDVYDRSDREEEAYQRWRLAVRAMRYPWSDVVTTAVCHDTAPAPVLYKTLREGLNRLTDWYRDGAGGALNQKIHKAAAWQ